MMDIDDDFIGEIEFKLSAEQAEVVNRAIDLASSRRGDEFAHINPLIVIMQWWQENAVDSEQAPGSPEARLAEACTRYLAANTPER